MPKNKLYNILKQQISSWILSQELIDEFIYIWNNGTLTELEIFIEEKCDLEFVQHIVFEELGFGITIDIIDFASGIKGSPPP